MLPNQAIHLLYALVLGFECIHQAREYHGDLHSDNIIVEGYGLEFDLKILDFFQWAGPKRAVELCHGGGNAESAPANFPARSADFASS